MSITPDNPYRLQTGQCGGFNKHSSAWTAAISWYRTFHLHWQHTNCLIIKQWLIWTVPMHHPLTQTTGWFSPFEAAKHLSVTQELAEVDVEHVAGGAQHDVVVVPVADPQDVRGHAASGARVDEVLWSLRRRERLLQVQLDTQQPLPGCMDPSEGQRPHCLKRRMDWPRN